MSLHMVLCKENPYIFNNPSCRYFHDKNPKNTLVSRLLIRICIIEISRDLGFINSRKSHPVHFSTTERLRKSVPVGVATI